MSEQTVVETVHERIHDRRRVRLPDRDVVNPIAIDISDPRGDRVLRPHVGDGQVEVFFKFHDEFNRVKFIGTEFTE